MQSLFVKNKTVCSEDKSISPPDFQHAFSNYMVIRNKTTKNIILKQNRLTKAPTADFHLLFSEKQVKFKEIIRTSFW